MWRDLYGSLVEKVVLIAGGFSGQSKDSCFTAQCWWCDASKNRELIDRSGVQAMETVRKAVLSVVSSFLVWELLHQTGEQYSVAEKTSAWVEVRRVLVKAPQVVPDKRRIRATRADVLADKFSRCWRNVSMRSSLTPRYIGTA